MQTKNYTFRKAEEKDLDFLIEAIIESEKSGTDKIHYCTFFDLSEIELRRILADFLVENIENQEIAIDYFLIAEHENQYAGTCSLYLENAKQTAERIKALYFGYFLDKTKMQKAIELNQRFQTIYLERKPQTWQVECVYVREKFRGTGLLEQLVKKQFEDKKVGTEIVQIQLSKTNEKAYKAYLKIGFEVKKESFCEDSDVLNYLPSQSRVLMELKK